MTRRELSRDARGNPKANLRNAYLLLGRDLRWRGTIAFDAFARRIMKPAAPPFEGGAAGEWSDDDTFRAVVWLADVYDLSFPDAIVNAAVSMIAQDNAYHPVRAYLESLRWDGTPRLRDWLYMTLGVGAGRRSSPEDPVRQYAARVGTMWLVSAVARVMRPGVKADHVLILEGPQGLGKSSALRILGGEWVLDTPIVLHDKEAYQQIQGRWIVELAELDSLNKSEATVAKAFFSRGTDRYRPPYAKHAIDAPRQCVFAGTTNQVEYLRDPTGARRFWPVRCQFFEPDELHEQRDQLWAEAAHVYAAGVPWWPGPEDLALFADHAAAREAADPWEEILAAKLDPQEAPEQAARNAYRMAELLALLDIGTDKIQERATAARVGAIMARLGWTKVEASRRDDRADPARRWRYERPAAERLPGAGDD